MVGETEESLMRSGVGYIVGRAPYFSSARGRIIGDSDGFLKLLFRRDDLKLLGVHVIGEQATELIHVGLMALLTGSRRRSVRGKRASIFRRSVLFIKLAALDAMKIPTTGAPRVVTRLLSALFC